MLTQKRFEELVDFAQKGNIELMGAIRMAEHEVTKQKCQDVGRLLGIINECVVFFSEHPNPESEELLKKCQREIESLNMNIDDLAKPLVKSKKEKEFVL